MRYATNDASNRNGALRSTPPKQLRENCNDCETGGNDCGRYRRPRNGKYRERSRRGDRRSGKTRGNKTEFVSWNACREHSNRYEGSDVAGKACAEKDRSRYGAQTRRYGSSRDEGTRRSSPGENRRTEKHRGTRRNEYARSGRCRRKYCERPRALLATL